MSQTVNAGRSDLDHLLRAPQLAPGEPMFMVRGRDPAAFAGVLGWARKSREMGVPLAVIEQGLRQGDAIAAWTPKRLPDADHLTGAEILQLEYQHSRRSWNLRDETEGPLAVLAAERRGWDAAWAKIRSGAAA
jgi:hypothetical protein